MCNLGCVTRGKIAVTDSPWSVCRKGIIFKEIEQEVRESWVTVNGKVSKKKVEMTIHSDMYKCTK